MDLKYEIIVVDDGSTDDTALELESLDIENLDINSENESIDDDSVLIEDDSDIDPTVDAGIKPTEEDKEDL